MQATDECKEAKALGVDAVPVLIGPASYLLLSKPTKDVEKIFSLLSFLSKILPIYKEVIFELKAAGASWIQFDEPTLVLDLDSHQLQAFTAAYADLETTLCGLNVSIETYFADLTAEAYKTIIWIEGCYCLWFGFAPCRNLRLLWAKSNLWCPPPAHFYTAVDLVNETKLDDEIESWFAFAAQKVVEVNALAKALAGQKGGAFSSANAAALKGSDHRRATNVSARLDAQQKELNLPILPTTTIGSFPQTVAPRLTSMPSLTPYPFSYAWHAPSSSFPDQSDHNIPA